MTQRNPAWTLQDSINTRYSIQETDTFLYFDPDPALPYAENGAFALGSISGAPPFDFIRVTLQAGAAYNFGVHGETHPVELFLFDAQGYLLLSTDPDDLGRPDPARTDTIIGFRPELDGPYYLAVNFTGTDRGAYEVAAVEDLGADGFNGPAPILALTPASVSHAEGAAGTTAFQFAVTRGGAAGAPVSATWQVAGSGANPADAADFLATTGTVSFAAGETQKLITVQVRGDRVREADEAFTLSLTGGSAGVTLGGMTAAGLIRNDDPGVAELSVIPPATGVTEGSGTGISVHLFTIRRTGELDITSQARWSVQGSGANPADAADFSGGILPSGTVTFAPGETEVTVKVRVVRDTAAEAHETFQLTLDQVSAGSLAVSAPATGTILNDDAAPAPPPLPGFRLVLSDSVREGSGDGVVVHHATLTRAAGLDQAARIAWNVVGQGDSPVDAADFQNGVMPSGVFLFAEGQATQTVKIRTLRDREVEANESFSLLLRDHDTGASIASPPGGWGSITLIDDDARAPTYSLTPLTTAVTEGSGTGVSVHRFTVTRSGDLSQPTSIHWSGTGSGANPADAADFQGGVLPGGRVNFLAGQTSAEVTVRVLRDRVAEGDEGFTVALHGPGSQVLATANATIRDDDTPRPAFTVTPTLDSRAEGTGTGISVFSYMVTRQGDLSVGAQAGWSVAGSGANPADAADFLDGRLPGGTLNFAPGQASLEVKVRVLRDAEAEANEGFTLSLPGTSAMGLILDDDSSRLAASTQGDLQLFG